MAEEIVHLQVHLVVIQIIHLIIKCLLLKGSRRITLKNQENIILNGACTSESVYDSKGEYIGGTNALMTNQFIYDKLPLPAGEYIITSKEVYSKYSSSKSVIFFLSSGYNIPNIVFNANTSIGERAAHLFKLQVNEKHAYTYTTNNAQISLFDSNLNGIALASSNLVLDPGIYYILARPFYCTYSGSFNFIDIGRVS